MVYFIGCLHLSHENMAISRGFSGSLEHDEYLVKQWNKVISKRHKVFILGDVSMEKEAPYETLKRLNGYKHVNSG